jgi:F0F1-type ATP synthase membrane subunit b/b'
LSVEASSPASQPARATSSLLRWLTSVFNKLIVSLYRTVGFVVLTLILVGLVSFLFTKLFFLFNRSWIAPTLLSPTDERIVRLNSEIVQQSTLRDKLLVERASLEVNLKDAERRASTGASLSQSLTLAVKNEAKVRHGERQRLLQLSNTLDEVRKQVADATGQFADVSSKSLQEQYQAGLTTRDRLLSGGLQLGQLAQANLALAEKASELEARGDQMKRDAHALVSAILAPNSAHAHLNVDSLRLRQDFMRGALDVARAQDEIKAYTDALTTTDRSIARYGELLKVLSEAPLLKALSGSITIAFVPYENLTNVHKGSGVFACRVGMVGCRRVGQVNQVLSGEVSVHSPVDSKNERGLMLELALQEGGDAAQDQVLFLNHAPLFF